MNYPEFVVEVLRGQEVESHHQVLASLFYHDQTYESHGDGRTLIFPRSSLKPFQALPFLTTGAFKHFETTAKELALTCASHLGEPFHISELKSWMARLKINESSLECGTHPPFHPEAHAQLLRAGGQASPIHNNCSGKHIGMIATALYLNEPILGYTQKDHPVQKRILQNLETITGERLLDRSLAIDGCSIPAPTFPLKTLARAFCDLAYPQRLSSNLADGCIQIVQAFTKYPALTSGTGQYCELAMSSCVEPTLIKMGAEGMIGISSPKLKLGIVIKSVDGSHRAAELVSTHLLIRLGLIPHSTPLRTPQLKNWVGREVGILRIKNEPDSSGGSV